jgi:hypothetical protein
MRLPILTFFLGFSIVASAAGASDTPSAAAIVVRNEMPVLSSDGVRVALVNHVPGNERAYGPDEMFFTADRFYKLRRIYAREVSISAGTVRLKMTAAQFRARNQNPD